MPKAKAKIKTQQTGAQTPTQGVQGDAQVRLVGDPRGGVNIFLVHYSGTEVYIGRVSARDQAHQLLVAECVGFT